MVQSSSKDSSTGVVRVSLDDACFVESVKRYIDEDKPEKLQQKQMEAWRMEWKDSDDAAVMSDDLHFAPTHALTGTLQVCGEYLAVTLSTECYWTGDCSDGSLFFSCHASARFRSGAEVDTITESSANERKKEAKIRTKMIDRLRQDDYIGKLLLPADDGAPPLELCQASIHLQTDQLEERVHCSEVAAEAVRRAVFSASESPLDVFDLVCRLPFLPCTTHSVMIGVQHTTALADRAKLRLLEDATYDACENEAEDGLVEDLKLDNNESESNTKKKRKR